MGYFIGMDIHRKFSQVCVMNENGEVSKEKRIEHEDEHALIEWFSCFEPDTPVVMEACWGWVWLAERLEALGLDVHLAHMAGVRMIAESRLKTDKVDAFTLAQLLRTDYLPEAYLAPAPLPSGRSPASGLWLRA